jgi:hypothetical protein
MPGTTFTTFDLSGFLALPCSLQLLYKQQWNFFEQVQASNTTVSTLRANGDKSTPYVSFLTYADSVAFTNGRVLHMKRFPTSNWNPVPEN